MKLAFVPISIVSGLLAGAVGTKLFGYIWKLVDNQAPPRPEDRRFSWPKLIAALLIEGAIFRLVKGLVDHGTRRAFARTTGTWPGEEAPDSE